MCVSIPVKAPSDGQRSESQSLSLLDYLQIIIDYIDYLYLPKKVQGNVK